MTLRRVVITGLSAISPLGNDLATSWSKLLAGESGVSPITSFDTSEHLTRFAGQVTDFDPTLYMSAKQARRLERFCTFSIACSKMLLQHAGLEEIPEEDRENTGCLIGCGLGGLKIFEETVIKLDREGPRRVSPFCIPVYIANMAPGLASIELQAKGPNLVTTSACASGIHAIIYAYSDIAMGRADMMVTGGVESTITSLGIAGFNAMRALSTRNDDPQRASRPFDKNRDGFVMGEGCGMLLLESLEHAQARGANILAELVGCNSTADAYHMTAPAEDGDGMARAMSGALRTAGMSPDQIEHINAHATSTPLNDVTETRAIKKVFGKRAYDIPITANKSMMGHLLGGAGGVESVFSIMSLVEEVLPPTINLETPDPECDLDYITEGKRKATVANVLCNSFGFGGTNASVIFSRWNG